MLRSITGTAGTLTLVLLLTAGCSGDDEPVAAGAPAPVAAEASAAAPAPSEAASPAPAPSGTAAPTDSRGLPLSSDGSPPPPPSRPAGHKFPDAGSLRVGWVDATVLDGGGNCYSLKDADGDTWAVYSKKDVPVDKGDKVRARITPGKTPVDCGSGKPATLVRVLIGAE
ncbi:hypothetical protein [Actinoplanes sp. M2I2]|uniref:hypothetical protein n=1 Tax=Actinoplanes sp. M2I2 TaxID=1734444 RepID=UPI0020211C62|nr:hypothetical protein [Actinoplanes sp. M2I2]